MNSPRWIDCSTCSASVGEHGYLVRTLDTNTGRTSWSLRERPLRTNQSCKPRLDGWCGETDNKSRYAVGVARIVRFNKAGDRAQIATVSGDELVTFLEADGYPELAV